MCALAASCPAPPVFNVLVYKQTRLVKKRRRRRPHARAHAADNILTSVRHPTNNRSDPTNYPTGKRAARLADLCKIARRRALHESATGGQRPADDRRPTPDDPTDRRPDPASDTSDNTTPTKSLGNSVRHVQRREHETSHRRRRPRERRVHDVKSNIRHGAHGQALDPGERCQTRFKILLEVRRLVPELDRPEVPYAEGRPRDESYS